MGNLQTNLDKTYDSIPVKDPSDAKQVIAAIKNAEDKYQISLDDLWANMQENLLKRMRRA